MNSNTFPSQSIIEEINSLPKITASPTDFKGMVPEEIARAAIQKGGVSIDISKASPEEQSAIRAASEIEIDGQTAQIAIHEGTDEKENQVLRGINAEILGNPEAADSEVNIGRTAFREFVRTMIEDPENYPLVRDEWNKFIVGHSTTGKIRTPLESHHLPNVGLKRASEGEDAMRDEVIAFVASIVDELRQKFEEIFTHEDILQHSNPDMNTPENRSLALGLAEYSNFARGAAYLRYRRGEKSLADYKPRQIAAGIIDKLNGKTE